MEKVYQLITRDGLKSEMKPLEMYRHNIITPLKQTNIKYAEPGEDPGMGQTFETREYRFKRVKTIEIYEYEEI